MRQRSLLALALVVLVVGGGRVRAQDAPSGQPEPEQPGVEPEQPGVEPEQPGAEPEQPGAEPEQPGVEPEQPGVEPERPGANPDAAQTAPVTTLTIAGFLFVGNKSIPAQELQTVVADYVGRSCDLPALREAAARITDEYHRRGMDLVRAYLPPQEIANGYVTIAVLEGEFGRVIVEGNTNYSSELIREHIEAGVATGTLTSEELEHALLVLNDFKDLEVSAVLERGERPGTVDIRAKVEDAFPVRLTLSVNNHGSRFVSRHRFGAQIDWTNALLPGALLSLSGIIGEEPDNLAYGSALYVVPVNTLGTKVGATGGYGSFQVSQDLDALDIHGEQVSGGVFVSHPFIKSRAFTLAGDAGVQLKNAKFFALDEVTGEDDIRTFSLGFFATHITLGGKTFAGLSVTQGLGSILGGMKSGDPDASRLEADGTFTRLTMQLARIQPIGGFVAIFGRVSGQWSSDPLVASEEWQVGGADSVRGYAPGEAAGDHGFVSTVELRVTPLEDKEILVLVAFVDHGAAYRDELVIGQEDHETLTGAGLGVRSHFEQFVSVDLRLEVGWPIAPHDNVFNERPVLYAAATLRF